MPNIRVDKQKAIKEEVQSAEAMIRARNIYKMYRAQGVGVQALAGVSLTVETGQMIAIMGASGSGKTTLLNCLAGLDTIDKGKIIIAGTNIAELSDAQRTDFRARTMGFIFQSFNLLPVLNAVENVELPLLILRTSPQIARKRARELLNAVNLSHREQHRPAELSGGQRQRVAIARALVNSPAILWADEPTGNLDSEAADEVMNLLQQLNKERSQTIVMVTHAADIGARANRIITMRDGKII
jgi:putative ABC transport system ATP-binding protein